MTGRAEMSNAELLDAARAGRMTYRRVLAGPGAADFYSYKYLLDGEGLGPAERAKARALVEAGDLLLPGFIGHYGPATGAVVPAGGEPVVLSFSGEVDAGADPDGAYDGTTIRVGGRDVLAEVEGTFGHDGRVTVALADDRWEGRVDLDLGSRGYSEYTPGDAGTLRVGEHSLSERLWGLDGQQVRLWISTGPVDLGEGDDG